MITPQVTRCIPGTALVEMLDAYQRSERGLPTYLELRALCNSPAILGATSAIIIASKDGEIAPLTAECERLAEVRNAAVAQPNIQPVKGSIGDYTEFYHRLDNLLHAHLTNIKDEDEARQALIAYIDSRAPAAPRPEHSNKDMEWLLQCVELAHEHPEVASELRANCVKTSTSSVNRNAVLLQARSPEGDPWQTVSISDYWKAQANGYEVQIIAMAAAPAAAQPLAGQDVRAVTDWEIIEALWEKTGRQWRPTGIDLDDNCGYFYTYRQLVDAFRKVYALAAPSPVNPKQEQA